MTQTETITKIRGGINALTAGTGVVVLRDDNNYCPLGVGDFYFPLGNRDALVLAAQAMVDAAFAGTLTIECTNANEGQADAPDRTNFDNAADAWLLYNPAANPLVVLLAAVGATFTAATGSVAITAGQVGGAMWILPNFAPGRARMHVHCTTPGKVKVVNQGKY